MSEIKYYTQEGLDRLHEELNQMISIERPLISKQIAEARDKGDLSENAEYVAARDELSFIDGRIDELEELLKQAVLIQESHTKGNSTVKLGSTVTVHIKGKKEIFTVVGEWEADPKEKKISHESPLGKALLGKKIGEKVEVEAPAGQLNYTIVSVS